MPRSDQTATDGVARVDDAALGRLTGVRSGKKSYYVELRRTEERMTSAVQALEGISAALVHTRDDPRGLLHGVLRAAAGHLQADWTMVSLRPGVLPDLGVRFLAARRSDFFVDSELALPPSLRDQLLRARVAHGDDVSIREGWVRVPIVLDGELLGRLVVSCPLGDVVDPEDLWVLRILANHAAMSIHSVTLYRTATGLRESAQGLYDEIARSSQDLETRTAQLEQAEGRLQVLNQRELLDAERHRIALELHDSVAQYVLSAGLAVDVCRSEAIDREGDGGPTVARLQHARDLVAQAGDQVRTVIYALHHQPAGDQVASLDDLLHDLAAQYRPTLAVSVRVEGVPVPLGAQVEHALARVAGEALFNTSIHGEATRAMIRLRYAAASIELWVSDDGTGDPRQLRRRLKTAEAASADGRHQGLPNMAHRARDLGGTFAIRRANLGGVRIEVCVPLPVVGTG